MRICANISMLFNEFPLPDRVHAAADAGFDGVEIQFPASEEIPALKQATKVAGIPIVLINVPKGPEGAVGLAALPGQEAAFRAAVEICAAQASALGVAKVNVLAGRPVPGADRAACLATLKDNLQYAADVMAKIGVRVMVEPVNPVDVPGFFLTDLEAALALLESIKHPNLALQFDLYHMSITEPDLVAAIARAGAQIGHVQFADTPGRNEPGTGTVDFAAAILALKDAGYDGDISAEYRPVTTTADGLAWLATFKEMTR